MKKPFIRQLSATESIIDYLSLKTTQANIPATGVSYTTEQGRVIVFKKLAYNL